MNDTITRGHSDGLPSAESHMQSLGEIWTARFLRDPVESDRGESGNESIESRRVASVLGRGSEVFETGLETAEGN